MDAHELFRKLGTGAKFDVRRFRRDAERFGVLRTKEEATGTSEIFGSLDFFGKKTKENELHEAQTKTLELSDLPLEEVAVPQETQAAKKRKGDGQSTKGRKKKKKGQETVAITPGTENNGILWMSTLEAKLDIPKNKGKKEPKAEKLKQVRQQKINHFRNKHKIYIQGTDLPEPAAKRLNFDHTIMGNASKVVTVKNGHKSLFSLSLVAFPFASQGRELLACAPTGSGKTLAFSIPILTHLKQPMNKGFRALVLSPTRELASQTHRELLKLSEGIGFRIHLIHKAAETAKKFGPKSSQKFDILVTTPNRLIYLLKQDPPAIDLTRVEWLVVDESDKLFEDGKTGFRDQLATIFLACSSHVVKRAMFSATFAHDVEQWCKLNLDNIISVSIGARNAAVETVDQELLFVGSETGKLLAVRDLVKKGFRPPVLVFVQSIERAKELFHELVYEGINVDVIHAEKTQQQRDNVVHSFRAGKIWILICTALLARGIDFKGVNMVINFDFPSSAVEYIHRIGRTGRAGHTGKAITFFTEDDKPLLRSIASVIQRGGCPVPDYIKHFRKLQSKQKKKFIKKPLERAHILTSPKFLQKKAKKNETLIQKRKKNSKEVENNNSQTQATPKN
ncbi:probable ATP-dependent RNA helicase DDX52 [Protobothrops mucrosquamatus]|uniref:probable ATP-dependent RNA helicase DDX52 n=1 Tax=Protobothrops mucrosquamatus TaxID=103944 RepID=UPI0010FB5F79|nr:probable ATP-dependent RNA helicase DDX52 [Protobothrops mucrosquamatus]